MNEIIRLLRRSKAVQRLCFRQSTAAHIQASRPFSRKFQFIGPLHPVSFLYVSIRLPGNSCLYVFYHVKFVLHVSCKYAPCALYPASQNSCPLMSPKTQMSVLQQSDFSYIHYISYPCKITVWIVQTTCQNVVKLLFTPKPDSKGLTAVRTTTFSCRQSCIVIRCNCSVFSQLQIVIKRIPAYETHIFHKEKFMLSVITLCHDSFCAASYRMWRSIR